MSKKQQAESKGDLQAMSLGLAELESESSAEQQTVADLDRQIAELEIVRANEAALTYIDGDVLAAARLGEVNRLLSQMRESREAHEDRDDELRLKIMALTRQIVEARLIQAVADAGAAEARVVRAAQGLTRKIEDVGDCLEEMGEGYRDYYLLAGAAGLAPKSWGKFVRTVSQKVAWELLQGRRSRFNLGDAVVSDTHSLRTATPEPATDTPTATPQAEAVN